MKNFLLTIAILLSSLSVRATHVMGADMSYRFIGNGKYEITVKVYRDCNGIQLSQSNVILRCGSNTVTVSNQTKVSV